VSIQMVSFVIFIGVYLLYSYGARRYLRQGNAKFIALTSAYFGTIIGIASVAGATGLKVGDFPVQVVRFAHGPFVSILLLYLAFMIEVDLLGGHIRK